jgi:hypothetical protein
MSGLTPEEEESVELWIRALEQSPLLERYMRKPLPRHNTRSEDGFGHRLYALLQCALAAQGKLEIAGIEGQDFSKSFAYMMLQAVSGTQIYMWNTEIERIASSAPLPRHTVSREVLPWSAMFWSRELPITLTMRDGDKFYSDWMGVFDPHAAGFLTSEDREQSGTDGIMFVMDVFRPERQPILAFGFVPYKKLWPDDYTDGMAVGDLLRRCAFLNSTYVTTEHRKLPRQMRRQGQRNGLISEEQAEEELHIVKLRRLESKKSQQPSGEHRDVDWKHQWWVTHHYRAQWYPSDQAHRVIYIAPYLKGPPDAPMLEKIYAVVR